MLEYKYFPLFPKDPRVWTDDSMWRPVARAERARRDALEVQKAPKLAEHAAAADGAEKYQDDSQATEANPSAAWRELPLHPDSFGDVWDFGAPQTGPYAPVAAYTPPNAISPHLLVLDPAVQGPAAAPVPRGSSFLVRGPEGIPIARLPTPPPRPPSTPLPEWRQPHPATPEPELFTTGRFVLDTYDYAPYDDRWSFDFGLPPVEEWYPAGPSPPLKRKSPGD